MIPEASDLYFKSLIKEGLDGQLAIIGFPFDIGLMRSANKTLATGLDNGPDSFRRFLDKAGPVENAEFGVSLKDLKVSDYGNIRVENPFTLEALLEKHRQKCLSVLRKNGHSITIGGSSDCSFGPISGLMDFKQKGEKVLVLKISNHTDFKPLYDSDKITSESSLRKIFQIHSSALLSGELKAHYFGLDSSTLSEHDYEYLSNNEGNISLHPLKSIRTHQIQSLTKEERDDLCFPITQAGQEFRRTLEKVSKDFDYIHLSFKLEALNAAYCPGVSNPSVTGGLTAEEAREIALLSGRESKIVSLDFTDYNPKFEDFRTGLLLAGLVYYFALGFRLRLK